MAFPIVSVAFPMAFPMNYEGFLQIFPSMDAAQPHGLQTYLGHWGHVWDVETTMRNNKN